MVSKNSSSTTPGKVLECLICFQTIPYDESKYVPEISEVLSDLFEVLCKYMEWSPPLRYQFNFNSDVFPFCKDCKSTLVTLYRSHQFIADVQKQINSVISNLCGKILFSKKCKTVLNTRNKFTDSSPTDSLPEEIQRERDEKLTYYRDLVDKRYSASVRVTAYIQPIPVPSPKIAIHKQDDFETPENCMTVEDEKVDFELLGNVESDVTETMIIEASLCKQETNQNEISENVEAPSPTIAIHRQIESDVSEKLFLVSDFEKLEVIASDDAETVEANVFNHEEIPEKTKKVKQTSKRTGSSGPELLILNHRRNPKRNPGKKTEQVNFYTEQSSNDEEVSSNEGQMNESDYEPSSNASCENEQLDDDDNFQDISKPFEDDVVTVRAYIEPRPRRGKFFDRVQNVGNGKYLFDEKYAFEHNSENNWVCSSCKYPYARKDKLLNHLAKICKGTTPTRRTKAREEREFASESTDDKEKCSSSNSHHPNLVSDTRKIEESISIEDHISQKHTDLVEKSNNRLEAMTNFSKSVTHRNVTLESEEETVKVISVAESKPSCLNSINGDSLPDRPIPDVTDESVSDEVQIRVESNIFRSAEFKNRIQKTGPTEYLLDDKISFENVNNKWRCIACDTTYTSKDGLRSHFDKCPGNPPADRIETFRFNKFTYDKLKNGNVQCRHCKHTFYPNEDSIVHLHTCHEAKPNPRRRDWVKLDKNKFLCQKKYPFEFTKGRYKCGKCSAVSSARWKILRHIRFRHIPAPEKHKIFIKSTTPGKFVINDKFSFEKIDDEYRCCECIYSSPALTLMRAHMREKHTNPPKFSCDICRRKFVSKVNLTIHQKTHVETVVCEICGKSYKTEKDLRAHKDRVHPETSEMAYPCNICGKGFRIQAVLNVHSKQHERGICDICGKHIGLTRLKDHVASHRNVKNHECKKCGKKFQHNVSLHVHMKCHDGVKPYSCDICDMKFTQHYSVTRHKYIAHNPNKSTKTYAKTRKRKREEDSSEEEEADEETSDEEELFEEISDGENSSHEEASEEELEEA